MRIAYSGWFLREGLRALGCEVVPLRLDATRTLDAQVDAVCEDPDWVFLEILGRTDLPQAIHESRHRLAVYCIDSVLNAYWLLPLARLCDLVYVDQLASVAHFRQAGVTAAWLPMCVSESDFRQPAAKERLITFVGRTSRHRAKRTNLLACIKARYPLHVVQDVSRPAMLDLFAASRIVLNENFFPGLNLRFLHALASGSLLLTERGGPGVRRHFQEGRHYAGYAPKDLIATIAAIERDPERYAAIAAQGQEACRQGHTSAHRARAVLADLEAAPCRPGLPPLARKLHEADGKYSHALRFGGSYTEAVALLTDAARPASGVGTEALHLLGSMSLRLGDAASGVARLEACLADATPTGLRAALTLMLLYADDERFLRYLPVLVARLPGLGLDTGRYVGLLKALTSPHDRYYHTCLLGCALLSDLGRNHALGFQKQHAERFPDYALEYAVLAFATRKTAQSLDAIIACTKKAGMATEALDAIRSAMAAGVATDAQIALAVSLAHASYDFAFAARLVTGLKKKVAP